MKKKFLSLMMAAAVVATTSVSAFADDYSWPDKEEQNAKVNIIGDVEDTSGNTVSGTLSVSIPTTTTFTVGQDGSVKAPTITVKNKGGQSVDVYAYKFTDNTPETADGITVVAKNQLETAASDYSTVSLRLNGSAGDAYLKSVKTGNGVYEDEDCSEASTGSGAKLVSVEGNTSGSITVIGETKKDAGAPLKAIQNKFVLTLKIKKADS